MPHETDSVRTFTRGNNEHWVPAEVPDKQIRHQSASFLLVLISGLRNTV